MSQVTLNRWNLLDVSRLDASHASLPTKERRDLYENVTQRFTINNDNTINGDITDNKFATRSHPIPLWQEIFVFLFFNTFVCCYFIPIVIFILSIWYFFSNGNGISLIITLLTFLFMETYPVKLWREFTQNAIMYAQYNYFSYRFVYHSSTKDYVTHQLMGTSGYKSLIFIGVPHAIFPYSIQLMPPIAKDCLNKPILSCMADVLYYLPIIRQLFLWHGAISASKKSIINALSKGYNIGLVPDGIAGMFIKSKKTENILVKNRKGVAKLSLQTGVSVVVCYGFGSTILFESYFDPWGIMQNLSRKLKMSIIAFAGKYYTLAPKRVPLYFVMGPVIKHPNNGIPIKQPTQQQIDEYHEQILLNLKTLFDAHKGFYGWEDKEIQFI